MQDIGMQYHIHCKEGDVGSIVSCPVIPAAVNPSQSISTIRYILE